MRKERKGGEGTAPADRDVERSETKGGEKKQRSRTTRKKEKKRKKGKRGDATGHLWAKVPPFGFRIRKEKKEKAIIYAGRRGKKRRGARVRGTAHGRRILGADLPQWEKKRKKKKGRKGPSLRSDVRKGKKKKKKGEGKGRQRAEVAVPNTP